MSAPPPDIKLAIQNAQQLIRENRQILEKAELPFSFGTEPIRAWRVWRLGGSVEEPRIVSTAKTIGFVWPARECPEALCVYHRPDLWPGFGMGYREFHTTETPHPAPARHGCKCGYWAMKDKLFPGSEMATQAVAYSHLIGEVALWGRVIETSRGYRAQYAYPLNLQFRSPGLGGQVLLAGLLSEAYGIPVYTWEEAQMFPSHVTQISWEE
jgi:hypothetical protein